MQSTPVRSSGDTRHLPLMHRLDQQLKVFKRGWRHNAMAEIEDVAGAAARAPKPIAGPLTAQLRRSKQHGRIQVALDAVLSADPIPTTVQRQTPVERDDIRA